MARPRTKDVDMHLPTGVYRDGRGRFYSTLRIKLPGESRHRQFRTCPYKYPESVLVVRKVMGEFVTEAGDRITEDNVRYLVVSMARLSLMEDGEKFHTFCRRLASMAVSAVPGVYEWD